MTIDQLPEDTSERRMVIDGRPDHRAWRENNDADGHWVCDGQGPPGLEVVVTPKGVSIYGAPAVMRPSVARWLALRTAEAAGIYEAVFGGDGTVARDGVRSRPDPVPPMVIRSGPAEIAATVWYCTCGKSGSNAGGGTIHDQNCDGTLTRVGDE